MRKNGTLFSQGRRRYVDRSILATMSWYPLARLEMDSSVK